MRFLLLLLFATSANAQYLVTASCLPTNDMTSTTTSPPYLTFNSVGVCVKWFCYGETVMKVTYCGTWGVQHLVGGRIQTIQKASDPLASLNSAGKRFTIVPLTDPSMAGMPK
jgi:hypothetical protein